MHSVMPVPFLFFFVFLAGGGGVGWKGKVERLTFFKGGLGIP